MRADRALDEVLAEERSWLGAADEHVLRFYIPTIVRALAERDSTAAEFVTSEALAAVVRTIAHARQSDGPLTVNDPVCGTGTLALEALHAASRSGGLLHGQDINPEVIPLAVANAYLASTSAEFRADDSLTRDRFTQTYDFVVADIPAALHWGHAQQAIATDPRYAAGVPSSNDATLLFAQAAVHKLRPQEEGGGTGILLCTPAPLVDAKGTAIRRWLLDQDLLECVVALPEGLATRSGIRLYALVLSTAKPNGWAGQVQVVDLRGHYAEAPKGHPEQRTITAAGLTELQRALDAIKPSASARPIGVADFVYDTVEVQHEAPLSGSRPTALPLLMPHGRRLDDWLDKRYGVGTLPTVASLKEAEVVRFDVGAIFPEPVAREVPQELRRLQWKSARLASLVSSARFVRSARAPERNDILAAMSTDVTYLVLPVETHVDAVATNTPTIAPPSRCLILTVATEIVDSVFAAAWLNSPTGRAARAASLAALVDGSTSNAPTRTFSPRDVWRLLDELVLPVPNRHVQADIAATIDVLATSQRAVAAAEEQMWRDPSTATDVRKRLTSAPREDLEEWVHRLPYPLAGAFWVFQTVKGQPESATNQLLRFWEATAEFLSVVFLSALSTDEVLRTSEFANLRQALERGNLRLDRATFGTWVVVVQRLAARFLGELTSGQPDAVDKVLHLFGNPPLGTIQRLLSSEVGVLLARVNNLRNEWLGHAGATTPARAQQQLDELVAHTDQLRDVLAGVWDDYRLVRAGKMAMRSGRFLVDVEVATGPVAPFRSETVELAEPLGEDGLYLLVDGQDHAIRLVPMVVLAAAPQNQSYTCYFYSRREPAGMRLVAYQYANENSVVQPAPEIELLLQSFQQATK